MILRILFLLFTCAPVFAEDQATLPKEWLGTWSGTLHITQPDDKKQEAPMQLKIEPIKDSSEFTWAITYGEGEKAVLRDYKLVPSDKVGRFRIDERNGIILEARLVNNVMYTPFGMQKDILTARYERRGETLRVEITVAKPVAEKTGKGTVQGYSVEIVQVAELKKK
jgi:hypothetical protein